MYNGTLKFKIEHNIKGIITKEILTKEEDEIVKNLYPAGYVGIDKLGRPLRIERIGNFKCQELSENFSEEKII